MAWVLDYSGWRPNVNDFAAMRANGIVGVSRYLAPMTAEHNWKRISKAEYEFITNNGLSVVLNWEEHAGTWRGGYGAGVAAGREARAQARAIGFGDDRPIIQSIDTAVLPSEMATAVAFQQGFNDGGGCGPQGCYGTYPILTELWNTNRICVAWQTAARAWYGNGPQFEHASMLQFANKSFPMFPSASYDQNIVLCADWGQQPRPVNEGDCGWFHHPGDPERGE